MFDNVDIALLVSKAAKLEFPAEILKLALNMHTAPRRLTSSQCVGPPIQPEISVLPGCGFAIAFARIYLREEV